MENNRMIILLAVVLVIVSLLAIKTGVVGNLLSYDCRTTAEAMQAPWYWDPGKGCFIQQPNGSWLPVNHGRTQYVP